MIVVVWYRNLVLKWDQSTYDVIPFDNEYSWFYSEEAANRIGEIGHSTVIYCESANYVDLHLYSEILVEVW